MPFFPGAQRAFELAKSGSIGRVLEVVSGFHHSSDLDPTKAANWKRMNALCGEGGALNDLGMHACHIPLRLGWKPARVFAQLQKGYPQRPDGKGGVAHCDTWDNALLSTWIKVGGHDVPMRLEMKRLMPGATNTWYIEILGTDGGVRLQHRRHEGPLALRARQGTVLEAHRPRFRHAVQDRHRRHLRSPASPTSSSRCRPPT
jgi:predicted dehydrogenase